MSNPEQLHTPEHTVEAAGDAARERQAELLRSPESSVESSPERVAEAVDSARRQAHEAAVSVEHPHSETGTNASGAHHVRPVSTRRARDKAYKDILRHTQAELPPASRAFSKVIHQPAVEKTSNTLGATIARPNAILFGALFAFLLSGSVYLVAKHYGYSLSGFEAIGAFIIGWAVGLLIDVLRVAARTK